MAAATRDKQQTSRAPHGARGLKYYLLFFRNLYPTGSRPARGAWIEIKVVRMQTLLTPSRAPHGARGLKLLLLGILRINIWSRPARGAWIEMDKNLHFGNGSFLSRPARGAWIEILFS